MMNKKGEGETGSRGALIAAIVAGAILVIMAIGLILFSQGKLPFFEWLPEWNQTKPRIVHGETFAYSFTDSKLKYYDGTSWIDFPSQQSIEVNEKRLDYNQVLDNFNRALSFPNYQYGAFFLASYDWIGPSIGSSFKYKALFGNIYIIQKADNNNWYYCLLGLDDKFECQRKGFAINLPLENQMKDLALNQRNALLKNPAQFIYFDIAQNKTINDFYTCMKINTVNMKTYLVADLTQRKAQTDVCT